MPAIQLSTEQLSVVDEVMKFLAKDCKDKFLVLSGPAGTGKTTCTQEILHRFRGRACMTAPTNKAVRVLKNVLREAEISAHACTIHSLLKLRMEANGEIKELKAPSEPFDISSFDAIFVDEGSMVNAQLMGYIESAAHGFDVKFVFLGDRYQLPPVKEDKSPIWELGRQAHLTTVMRHDNQILKLATSLRGKIFGPLQNILIDDDNDGQEGVFRQIRTFEPRMLEMAEQGLFTEPNKVKVVAWRNTQVDFYNNLIRSRIYPNSNSTVFEVGDRVVVTEPATLDDQKLASTDDEGIVSRIYEAAHPLYGEYTARVLQIDFDDNRTVSLWTVHPDCKQYVERELQNRLTEARANPKMWRKYWEFAEAWHKVRFAYAITAHRSQGSTYETVFVDHFDILGNRNRREALQCLYVAATRAKKQLWFP